MLRQIGWREELKTAPRFYGQNVSLAIESSLLRQQRERAPPFYGIPLPGGGVLATSLPHIHGKTKGKSSKNRFSVRLLCTLPALSLEYFL